MPIDPIKIRLDAATACQLKCPSCPTARGDIAKSIGTGFLKFEDFKELINDNPRTREIELSNWGEIFLNPDIVKIMEYAYSRNVSLSCANGANFNRVSDEMMDALVKYRFHSITCSIDGASPESYAIYRQKGNFDHVLDNIRKLNQIKKKYNSQWPQLKWQFIVFGHNEHEIPKARKMAKSLGMRFWVKLSWDDMYTGETFSPIKNKEIVEKEVGLGVADRRDYQQKYGERYMQRSICSQLWLQPQINFDGKILGCCVNHWGDYGNAFKNRLSESLNNQKIEYARGMLMGQNKARADIPCFSCAHYASMKEHKNWLTKSDIVFLRFFYKYRSLLPWYFLIIKYLQRNRKRSL